MTWADAHSEAPAAMLNSLMEITRAGGHLGIPGLYVPEDPGAKDENAKKGILGLRIGVGWSKSQHLHMGQAPVMKYNRQLMQAILYDKIKPARAINVSVITLDEAPQGYKDLTKARRSSSSIRIQHQRTTEKKEAVPEHAEF
jgi:glutathione-independent formaldehyde dehydrogenase